MIDIIIIIIFEPLSAAGIEDLLVGVLDLHPRAVEVDPAGVEVAHLVAGEHLWFQEHIVVVERDCKGKR